MNALKHILPSWVSRYLEGSLGNAHKMITEAALDVMSDAVIIVDVKGNIDYLNQAATYLLQMKQKALLGKPFAVMIQVVNAEKNQYTADNFFDQYCASQPLYDQEWPLMLRRSDGSEVLIEDYAAPIASSNGEPLGAVIVLKNVSERRRAQDVLDLSNKVFHELLDFIPDAILIAELGGKITLANVKAAQLFGYESIEMSELTMLDLIPRCQLCGVCESITQEKRPECVDTAAQEMRCFKKGGEEFPGEVSLGEVSTVKGRLIIVVVRDISQRKHFEHQISYQATHNTLTRLPNRTLLLEQLQEAMEQAKRNQSAVGLMFVDLDNFKNINDTLGHAIGDLLLCEIAARLRDNLLVIDELAHIGGDEFVLVLQNIADRQMLEDLAFQVLKIIDQPCDIQGQRIQVSASIGITVYPDDGEDSQTLLRNADMAMYRAKEKGRNNSAFYVQEMHNIQQMRLDLSNALRCALENHEFELHYQPKLNLHTGRISSVEALIRWRHPQKGMIAPGFFIPLAEEYGLIVDIGAWVIDEACRQITQWRAEGLTPLRVAVNLSAGQCQRDDIYKRIMNTLQAYGVEPKHLELEITESMVLHDPKQALLVFQALDTEGVHIAIDDFGTGYSSFSYLKRFPSKALKIDKSFVDGLEEELGNLEIIRAIISVAHHLGMRVVAEGVETAKQLDLLRDNGCDYIQGYLISRPLQANDIAGFIIESERRLWAHGV